MIKQILKTPDNLLRQKSEEVVSFDRSLAQTVTDLTETLISQIDPVGLGLSAVQVGILKRVFVARVKNRIRHFVNPKILKFSKKEITFLEGCFSVPEFYGHVIRPVEIDLEAQDKHGKKTKGRYTGLPARIIQHEIDHLDGILFTDHVHNQNGKIFKIEKDKKGKEQLVEVAFA